MRGPRRSTLCDLARACQEPSLFTEAAPGRYVLTASKTRLAGWLGIHRSSLNDRLRTLSRIGAVVGSDAVTLDLEVLERCGDPGVVPLRPRSHPGGQILESVTCGPSSTAPPAHGRSSVQDAGDAQPPLVEVEGLIALLRRLGATVRNGSWTSSDDPRLLAVVEFAAAAAEQFVSAPPRSPAAPNATRPSEAGEPLSTPRSPDPASVAKTVAQPVAPADFRHFDGLPRIEPDSESEVSAQDQRNRHRPPKSIAKPVVSPDTAGLPGLAAERRDLASFGSIPDWNPSDWEELVRPAEEAWWHKTGELIRIANRSIVAAAQGWPRIMVEGAVTRLVADIEANHTLIGNPGAILCQALREGWYRYLPQSKSEAESHRAASTDQLREIAIRWRHQAHDEDYPDDLLAECLYGAYGRPECHAVPQLAVALRSVAQSRPEIIELYATSFANAQGISSAEQLLTFIREECDKAGLIEAEEASTEGTIQPRFRSAAAVRSGSKRTASQSGAGGDDPRTEGNSGPTNLRDCLLGSARPAPVKDEAASRDFEAAQAAQGGEIEPMHRELGVLPLERPRQPDERTNSRRRARPLRPAEMGILDADLESERKLVGGGRV